jgi:hypothetical protein
MDHSDYEDSKGNGNPSSIQFAESDHIALSVDGNHLPEAAQALIDQIRILSSPPTNGRSFLVTDVYGRGAHTAAGDAYVQRFLILLVLLKVWTHSLSVSSMAYVICTLPRPI